MSDRLEDIIEFRKQKLDNFKKAGIDPYPSSTSRTHTNSVALEDFNTLQDRVIILAGRIRSLRVMGKLAFFHIEDGTARIQVLLKADEAGESNFQFFQDNFDIGDFVEVTGKLFETKTGEKTLQASSFKILAKSLRPLPSEHYGLEDQEIRLRQRYLDILLNPETKELFVKKNKFWSAMREFLVQHGFLEVQMPVLESIPGGAEAEPFITHHNALDKDFYLRISLELPLKKMLVAGYEKVFEIGRIFRNEGISTEHLQDYTQMEFYWAYGDFEKMMQFCQEMYQHVIKETFGTLKLTHAGKEVDWSGNWPRRDYFELFKKYTDIDLNTATEEELKKYADTHKISYEPAAGKGRIIDLIFKKKIRILPELAVQPFFLINQPIELEPLAKKDPHNPKAVQRMQILAYGSELGKGFGELNDPLDQRERFEAQMKLREAGDTEAQMLDEDYLEAMEYGMPPAAGFGISERLFSVLADKSIRETVIFPPMRDSGKSSSSHKPAAQPLANPSSGPGKIPTREEALELLHRHVKTPNLIKHMLATESFMRGLARKFGEDENKWGVAGLLHDIDYDEIKDPAQHSLVGYEILKKEGIDEEIAHAVKVHNDHHGIQPETLLDKALLAGETYTGFVTACALIQPDKKLASVNIDSAVKKFSSKSFAAGANRAIMKRSDELIGMPVEEMIAMCLKEMQGISDELGL